MFFLKTTGLVLSSLVASSIGFHTVTTGPRLPCRGRNLKNSKLFGPEDEYDDGIGNASNINSDKDEGQALAKDFYEQLRKREENGGNMIESIPEETSSTKSRKTPDDNSPSVSAKDPTVSPFSRPQEIKNAADGPTRKFTGQQSMFSRPSGSSTSSGISPSPREVMMEREFELVGRAERGIAYQAVFAVLALAFYIYIGLSGGIGSGELSSSEDFGGDDDIPFEQLMPVRRDTEASAWI